MFGLGMTEIILIAVVILVVVGPKKLPDIAKSIGKGYGEFRKSFNDLKQSVNIDDVSVKTPAQTHEEMKKDLAETYRSQWERKLPEGASVQAEENSGKDGGEDKPVAQTAETLISSLEEAKKQEGEKRG